MKRPAPDTPRSAAAMRRPAAAPPTSVAPPTPPAAASGGVAAALMRADTMPLNSAWMDAAAAAARDAPIPLPPMRGTCKKTVYAVQIHDQVKDRICAPYAPPIKVDAFVSEEYVVLLCKAYPPSATRNDIMTLGGKAFAAIDPFMAFAEEISQLPACPPRSSA